MKRILRGAGSVLGAAMLLLVAYGAAGMAGGAMPRNVGWAQPSDGVRILVESNGVHTDLVLPKLAAGVDWRDLLPGDDLADPRYAGFDHVAIGWGERTFYLETPTWADVRPLTVLRAAVGSDRTVLHVEHVAMPAAADDARTVVLRPEEYRRLAAFVRASFAGRQAWHRTGYGRNDAFYQARGRYSAIETCNAWTGDALRAAGVRIGAWTPFPVTVLGWFAPPRYRARDGS
ncbi:TIGR02117 family protein [Sphingomonas sp. PAMC 26605]|uniref:TIGR02117 family protein n=1 Tax=Sphingomonas sp. PAMC 26605 TaxID=1112214 RepID=UPI00056ABDFD|nr:TIGR02117 family protein [Sphingomonas sp. PAMC 26605]